MAEKLTPKQKAFADAYIECGNASEAARRAGYSEKNANVNGPRMLANAGISAYIAERMAAQDDRRVASADEVLRFFSAVLRGEEKDQFGLDASLSDRLNAGKELLKRYDAAAPAKNAPAAVNVDGALFENIADVFIHVHRDLAKMKHAEYWFKGGRASTKSSFISLELIRGLLEDDQANAVVFRKVGNTIKDSVYEQLVWAIDALGVTDEFTFRKSPLEIIRTDTGQRIIFRGADDPMKSKSLKLSRGYFKYLWFEELAEFQGMDAVRTIKQSVFRGVDKGVTFYSYNPPRSAQNWVNDEALKLRGDRLVHHSTYLDVPREWLKDAFVAEAEALKATNERAYRNEYLGEVTGTGGQVFDNLEERTITDAEIGTFDVFYNGLDFGFAVDPDAFTRWAYDKRARKLYAIAEYYGARTPAETLAEKVIALAGREVVTCDAADPRMISQLQRMNVNAIGCKKGPGSREHGYRWLQDLGAIIIDPKRTPNIAREFRKYEYAQDRNGNFLSEYPDKDDHCLTGDTIVWTTQGHVRIDALVGKTGEVVCYDENNGRAATARFYDVRMTGEEEIIEIELEDGRIIRASGEHPILTRRGWVCAGDLLDTDEILEVTHG